MGFKASIDIDALQNVVNKIKRADVLAGRHPGPLRQAVMLSVALLQDAERQQREAAKKELEAPESVT